MLMAPFERVLSRFSISTQIVLGTLLLIILATTVLAFVYHSIQQQTVLRAYRQQIDRLSIQTQASIHQTHQLVRNVSQQISRSLVHLEPNNNRDNGDALRLQLLSLAKQFPYIDSIEIFFLNRSGQENELRFDQGISRRDKSDEVYFYSHAPLYHPQQNHVVFDSNGSLSFVDLTAQKISTSGIFRFQLGYSLAVTVGKSDFRQGLAFLQVHVDLPSNSGDELVDKLLISKRSGENFQIDGGVNLYHPLALENIAQEYPEFKVNIAARRESSGETSFSFFNESKIVAASPIALTMDDLKVEAYLLGVTDKSQVLGLSRIVIQHAFPWVLLVAILSALIFYWFVRMALYPLAYLASEMNKKENAPPIFDLPRFKSSKELERLSRILKLTRYQIQFEENSINVLNEKIQSTETWSRNLLETIPSSILVVNKKSEIIIANKLTASLFGYEPSEIHEQSLLTFIPERFRANHFDLFSNYFRVPENKILGKVRMLYGLRKDGSEFPVEIGLAPLELDGELVVVANIIDMTQHMHYEQQLLRAKEEAVIANQRKSEFVANVSHEIRTPMNALVNLSKLALKTETNKKTRDYLLKIYSSSRALLIILNEILDFSKIEAGKMEIERTPFRLQDVLDNVYAISGGHSDEKPVELKIESREGIPKNLIGDPLRISQVLCNLVNNALKFTEKGCITVSVDLIDQDAGIGIFRFTVSDTGIGMSVKQQENIFSAFSQADSSISRRFGGTGLGLKICKQLVELMGGNISVSSEEGKGSHFVITLMLEIYPGVLQKDDRTNSQGLVVGELSFPTDSLKQSINGMHILVADDNDINQQIICEILQDANVVVDVVFNGVEVLNTLASHHQRYDAVLMDMQMPEMDGLNAARRIRSESWGAVIPIIAMSARTSKSDQQACFDAGMNDYVSKPIDDSEIIKKLSKWRQSSAKMDAINTTSLIASFPPGESSETSIIPDKIAFLDLQSVRKRTRISDDAMLRIFKRFRDNHRDFIRTMVTFLNNKNWDLARLQVHNIKGTAGYIGAEGLVEQAVAVEKALETAAKTGRPDIRLLEQAHSCVMVALDKLLQDLESRPVREEAATFEKDALETLKNQDNLSDIMRDIAEFLRDNNLSVRKELKKLHSALGNNHQELYKELNAQIELLDFAGALQTINRLKSAVNAGKGQVP